MAHIPKYIHDAMELRPVPRRKAGVRRQNLIDAECVYFIELYQRSGLVKIGRSKQPAFRIGEIAFDMGVHPDELRFLGQIHVRIGESAVLERALHKHFAAHREVGEWFDIEGRNLLNSVIHVCNHTVNPGYQILGLATEELEFEESYVASNMRESGHKVRRKPR